MTYEVKPQPETLNEAIKELGLMIKSEFVPWSKSHNAKPKASLNDHSLNWRVTLYKGDREVLTTDYMVGIAHCPSYKQSFGKMLMDDAELVVYETEHGFRARRMLSTNAIVEDRSCLILPEISDVVYSLVLDSDVLDYSSFEEWAGSMGFDPDSRKAEKTYQACLKIALAMRNSIIGEDGLRTLREAAQDY